jgi:hypothetical protein
MTLASFSMLTAWMRGATTDRSSEAFVTDARRRHA